MPINPQSALQMIPWTPYETLDYSGGFTDDYLAAPSNRCERNLNLVITADKKLRSRPGSVIYDLTAEKVSAGNDRVSALMAYDDDLALFAVYGTKISYLDSTWLELSGPSSNDALSEADADSVVSWAKWKKHLFLTDADGSKVVKIYQDDSADFQLRTAGLPKMAETENFVSADELAIAITLANELRTDMKAHFVSTAIHRAADNTSDGLIGAAATTLPTLLTLVESLVKGYQNHLNDVTAMNKYHYGWDFVRQNFTTTGDLHAQPSAMELTITETPTDLIEAVELLNEIRVRWNTHDGSKPQHNGTSGNHQIAATRISGVTKGPETVFNVQDLYDYFTDLLARYDAHLAHNVAANVAGTNGHKSVNSANRMTGFPITIATDADVEAKLQEIRAKFNDHIDDTTVFHYSDDPLKSSFYNLPYNTSNPSTFADTYNGTRAGNWSAIVSALNTLKTDMLEHFRRFSNGTDLNGNAWVPAANSAHSSGALTAQLWYATVLPDFALATYQYAFVYFYEYLVGTDTFQDFGPPLFRLADEVTAIGYKGFPLTSIPVLANGSTDNYDTDNIKIKIYRTIDAGDVFYLVDTIDNGTTSYTDRVSDEELITRETLYTSSDLPDNDPPPLAKYLHIADNLGYYAHCTVDGELKASRLYQSVPNDIDSVPSTFFTDLDQPLTGVASYKNRVLVFSQDAVYLANGSFDSFGRGSLEPEKIFKNDGCIAHNGIVEIPNGLVFPGKEGFYFTDGFTTFKISEGFNTTYATYVSTQARWERITGQFDATHQRVWWAMQGADGSDADSVLVLDTRWGITPYSSFSLFEGGASFAPTSLLWFEGEMLRADKRGYVFKHRDSDKSDPKVDTTEAAVDWTAQYIEYDFISIAESFDSASVRTLNPLMSFEAKNETNLSLTIKAITDDGKNTTSLKPVRIRTQTGILKRSMGMPDGRLRCFFRQVEFTNAEVVITNSDTLTTATLNRVAKTLTLGAGNWPTDPIDHVIAFADDEYVNEFTIDVRTSTVLTLLDPGDDLPANGVYEWVMRGFPKDEVFHLVSHCLYGMKESEAMKTVRATAEDTGANA